MVEESKSAQKREVEALQQLAIVISKLPEKQIMNMNLPEEVCAAILEYKKMKTNGAMRRQAQYLGRLMREADQEQIAKATAHLKQHKL